MTTKFKILTIIMLFLLYGCGRRDPDRKPTGQVPFTLPVDNYSYTVEKSIKNISFSEDDSNWRPCTTGMILQAGWYIESGKHSCAVLRGILGDLILLGERSKVKLVIEELSRYSSEKSKVRGLTLLHGLITLTVKKNGHRFIVETPSATAQVKGTQFSVRFDQETNVSEVSVLSGQVLVINKQQPEMEPVLISGGEAAVHSGNNDSLQKRKLTDREIEDFIDSTEIEEIYNKPAKEDQLTNVSSVNANRTRQRLSEVMSRLPETGSSLRGRKTVPGDDTVIGGENYIASKAETLVDFYKAKDSMQGSLSAERTSSRKEIDSLKDDFYFNTGKIKNRNTSSSDMFDELKSRKSGITPDSKGIPGK